MAARCEAERPIRVTLPSLSLWTAPDPDPKLAQHWWLRSKDGGCLPWIAHFCCLKKVTKFFLIFFSHLDHKNGQGFSSSGYFCPQCKSKYCELPVECKACGKCYFFTWCLQHSRSFVTDRRHFNVVLWSKQFLSPYRADSGVCSSLSQVVPSFVSIAIFLREATTRHSPRKQVRSESWGSNISGRNECSLSFWVLLYFCSCVRKNERASIAIVLSVCAIMPCLTQEPPPPYLPCVRR